jgi:hypothetical protein
MIPLPPFDRPLSSGLRSPWPCSWPGMLWCSVSPPARSQPRRHQPTTALLLGFFPGNVDPASIPLGAGPGAFDPVQLLRKGGSGGMLALLSSVFSVRLGAVLVIFSPSVVMLR